MPKGVTYRPKEKRWQGRFQNKDYKNGKPCCVYAKTQKECLAKLREKKAQVLYYIKNNIKEADFTEEKKTMTLKEWFQYWNKTYREHGLKKQTIISQNHLINDILNSEIVEKSINKINQDDIIKFLDSLKENRKENIFNILKQCFSIALETGHLKRNITNLTVYDFSKTKNIIKNKKRSLTSEEIDFVREKLNLSKHKYKNLFIYMFDLLYNTGLRLGELIALKWEDIDFEKSRIKIDKTYSIQIDKNSSTKTNFSTRYIPIFTNVKEILYKLSKNGKETLFETEMYSKFQTILRKIKTTYNIDITPHILRHTFATKCRNGGIDTKTIQTWLGHSSYETTMNVYVDLTNLKETKETIVVDQIFQN